MGVKWRIALCYHRLRVGYSPRAYGFERASHLRVSFASTSSDDRGGCLGDRVAASLPSARSATAPVPACRSQGAFCLALCYGGTEREKGVANMLQSELDGKRVVVALGGNALGRRRASS